MVSETDSRWKSGTFNRISGMFFGGKKNAELEKNEALQIEDSKKEMIEGILSLSNLNAGYVMIPRVDIVAVSCDITEKKLLEVILESGLSRIPVYEETIDNIVGILYVKDFLKVLSSKQKKVTISNFLHKPFFVPETIPLDELLFDFQKKRQHLAIVVDEYGGVAGLVTMENIFEEIFGDIDDEYDEKAEPDILKINKTTYTVDSKISIEELNSELDLNFPEDKFDTFGGFVLDLFGRIPEKDDVVEYQNVVIRVKEIKKTRLSRIIISVKKNEFAEG